MNRYEQLKEILNSRKCFKVVCGAGNEDLDEVRKLAAVYTLAGTTIIDISANEEVVKSCVSGIEDAYKLSEKLNIEIGIKPFINVSVGLKGDPHVRKARITEQVCQACRSCIDVCEQQAISDNFQVITERCIGCGVCGEACGFDAIEFYYRKFDYRDILPKCLDAGAENIELHATIYDDEQVFEDWKIINSINPHHFNSICLDRTNLSNSHLVSRIESISEVSGDRTIVQADGDPMRGSRDCFKTTLQAVATSDVVIDSGLPVFVLASGGTNSKTSELCRLCDVQVHGVSIGTHARKIIKQLIADDHFYDNTENVVNAVAIAKDLVNKSI